MKHRDRRSSSRRAAQPSRLWWGVALIAWVLGAVLLAINLYGLAQPLRKPGLGQTDQASLRFVPDQVWSYEKSLKEINALDPSLPGDQFLRDANRVVNRSLVHVDWNRVDPEAYRQRVPVWENYFLYLLGKFSGLPQFERYHYADYRRNIRRGIGICGDAATVLSSVLDRYQVDNRIVSFEGHVLVEAGTGSNGVLLDPDFGVVLDVPLDALATRLPDIRQRYLDAGYSVREIDYLMPIYLGQYRLFDDTYHFMSKCYLFENASYILKWLLPLGLMMASSAWLWVVWSRAGSSR